MYLSVGTYFNDHAKLWVSGPNPDGTAGSPPAYTSGPFSPDASMKEAGCEASEGEGKCYFVDSKADNNWIALRIRNSTHNIQYAESYGKAAMNASVPGRPGAVGVFKCVLNDEHCIRELYDYGPITSDYPNFPVMTKVSIT